MEIPGYTIIRELGRGGMATVHLAVQQSLEREVALKVMSPALLADETFGSRFLREAKIVAKLSHPNVIPIYDVGTHKDYYYIAMEYESGGELKQRIKNGLGLQEAVSITKQIASALQFAHSNGYIHRDVKPDNILFNTHDKALLTDFGVARAYDSTTKITAVGAVLGTPLYMSPEQVQGKTIDHRADLYSLGAVFYEMLMGYPPYRGDSAVTVAVKHMTDPVPLLPEKYAKLQPFFDKLLNKNADHRFQSGAEIISELDRTDLNDVGVSLVTDNTHSSSTESTVSPARAAIISDQNHEAPTVVSSEALLNPLDSPQAAKSNIPIMMISATLVVVMIIVGVLYFTRLNPPLAPAAQNTPVTTAQAEATAESSQQPVTNADSADNDHQKHIAELIALAEQDVAQDRLTRPIGNNAYEKYLDVLRLDAGNRKADAGLRALGEHFLQQVDIALKSSQFEQAVGFYDEAQRVYPNHPDLQKYQANIQQAVAQYEEQQKRIAVEQQRQREELEKRRKQAKQKRLAEERRLAEQERAAREKRKEQERLAALQAKQQQEQATLAELEKQKQAQLELQRQQELQTKINLLVDTAKNLLARENLTVGIIDQAYKIYNDIRAIDPDSPAIDKGVAAVVTAYVSLAEKELDDKQYNSAETIVQKGLAIDDGNSRLLKIRESIKKSKLESQKVFGGF